MAVKDFYVDAVLTNISQKYKNADLIAEQIFPVVNVQKDSGLFWKFGKQDFVVEDDVRLPGERAVKVSWKPEGTESYSTVEHALEIQLIDEERDNADEALDYETSSTELVTNKLKLGLEKRVATLITNPDSYANGHSFSPAKKWDNYSESDPIADVEKAKKIVRKKIFIKPNTMVVSEDVHEVLRRHPKLLELYKYTTGGVLTTDLLKEIFEVENYYVGGGGELVNDEIKDIWGDNVVLIYVPKNPGLKQISFGYTFRRRGFPLVERWREDETRSDWIRVSDKYDNKIVSNVAGCLISNVLE